MKEGKWSLQEGGEGDARLTRVVIHQRGGITPVTGHDGWWRGKCTSVNHVPRGADTWEKYTVDNNGAYEQRVKRDTNA